MEEIKRCPFCGNEATLVKSYSEDGNAYYFVECDDCGSRGESYTVKEYAIKTWNKRFDYSVWHDIVSNPKDLPNDNRIVELKLQLTDKSSVPYGHGFLSQGGRMEGYWWDSNFGWIHLLNDNEQNIQVIAWREVEP